MKPAEQIREKKSGLEDRILDLIEQFEEQTEAHVQQVRLQISVGVEIQKVTGVKVVVEI